MKNNKNSYVVCFGEILWDIFPSGIKAGGAPFNVAYNLNKMGAEVKMISKVGNDTLGNDLLNQIKNWDISTDFIQIDDEKPTGTVIANFDEHGEAHYDIVTDVAWDHIEISEDQKDLVKNSEAFVFGSLSARDPKSRKTLLSLLNTAKLKIFDVNFRPPFIDVELIKQLLHKADIVKMNKAEMRQIMQFFSEEYKSEDESAAFIQNHFNINEIVLTKGSKGARYFIGDRNYGFSAVPIEIADTVGSGDSFLAGFLSKRIEGKSPEEIMKQAVSLGAFITSKSGACPDYTYEEFKIFREKHYSQII